MSPVWDGRMRDLYARELRDVGIDPSVGVTPKFTYVAAEAGNPFNSLEVKGQLLQVWNPRPGYSTMHIRLYSRRLRVVVTPTASWIDFGGRDITWFPRHRRRRMAGK
jgi:hypothetical protein